jgi:restriction endonuclease S subunit
LDGLEAVEMKFSQVVEKNETFRFDSEYFRKDFLKKISLLKRLSPDILENLSDVKGGKRLPLGESFIADGIPYIRAEDVKNTFIKYENSPCISENTYSQIKSYSVNKNDVLLTIVGNSIGDIGVVKFELEKCNLTENCVKIISKNINYPDFNDYLFLFLMSHYGQIQIEREKVGTAQPKLAIERIRRFLVPVLSNDFQKKLAEIIATANNLIKETDKKYFEAETLLLKTLGLDNFTPSTQSVNIKSFKDSFVATGRLDAEYYQPKYDDIEKLFNKFDRIKISDLVSYPISSGVTPKAGGDDYADAKHGVPFVRAVDLKSGQVSTDSFNYIKSEIHNGMLKRTQLKKNDFLFSIAGTVGRCAIYEHDFEANINQAVSILRFNNEQVNHYYMMVLFNSAIGKEFVSKYARQGLQTNLNLSEVGELSIPIVDIKIQTQIAELVQQSFALKKESEQLLEKAKQAVELAIEQGEEVAMAYLGEVA